MWLVLVFVAGCFLGSLELCLVHRWNHLFSFFLGRSVCDCCGRHLSWRELIPIFSYLYYRGTCPDCKQKINPIYPLSELTLGLIFSIVYIYFNNSLYYYLFYSILFLMICFDLSYQYIPDLFQIGLFILLFYNYFTFRLLFISYHHFFILFILTILYFFFTNYIGGADLKLIGILCVCLPFEFIPYFFFLAASSGLCCCLITKVRQIPFVPFLVLAFLPLHILLQI